MNHRKPTICLDFDGCIHRYRHGWREGTIYDEVVEGFFEWAFEAQESFKLTIYSSRSQDDNGIRQMREWLRIQTAHWRSHHESSVYAKTPLYIDFASHKPAAFLTIDDRALRFDGDWSVFKPEELLQFKSWASDP